MSRSVFGWSLPPGVTDRMIDEAAGGYDEDESETRDQVSQDWREFTRDHPEFKGLEMLEALRLAESLVFKIKDFMDRWDNAPPE
jgi:hypothetical protein